MLATHEILLALLEDRVNEGLVTISSYNDLLEITVTIHDEETHSDIEEILEKWDNVRYEYHFPIRSLMARYFHDPNLDG